MNRAAPSAQPAAPAAVSVLLPTGATPRADDPPALPARPAAPVLLHLFEDAPALSGERGRGRGRRRHAGSAAPVEPSVRASDGEGDDASGANACAPAATDGADTVQPAAARSARRRERPWPEDTPEGGLATDQPAWPVRPEPCTSLLRANDAEGLPCPLSANPYRGCAGACVFCPAALRDPQAVVHAKPNAPQRLREELRRPRYQARAINLGSVADAYQGAEREQRLTRDLLALLDTCHHPVALATRSDAVVRDLDLLAHLAERDLVFVAISLCTLDESLASLLEPGMPAPARRLAALRRLARAGVPCGVMLSPLIPGLGEAQIEPVASAAAAAGARVLLGQTLSPDTLPAVQALTAHTVDGALLDGDAHAWTGWRRAQLDALAAAAAAHGLGIRPPELATRHFVPPAAAPARPAHPASPATAISLAASGGVARLAPSRVAVTAAASPALPDTALLGRLGMPVVQPALF